ncbi:hypothetical protein GCM10011499_20140 [Pelagibacterium lentulum]|uniref:Alcohol dehydrogenase iron-type/glycerol dehydrogenase GldA domain-containing protein n=1 Tax=Pelagibacterium lentulum TaxID=2029865 RepID=A0A916RCL6_9HYPH|nr:hypothetical protein GCM10011499_20140 [Pelagibacterium lentulum]
MAGDQLQASGVSVSVFTGVMPELPTECIADGVEMGRAANAYLVIGIGGGSCMDAAKIIALLLTHGGEFSDYYGEFKVPCPVLPLICLPTTAGTGSEVTPVAVVSDKDRAVKVGIASLYLIPHISICDPELTRAVRAFQKRSNAAWWDSTGGWRQTLQRRLVAQSRVAWGAKVPTTAYSSSARPNTSLSARNAWREQVRKSRNRFSGTTCDKTKG